MSFRVWTTVPAHILPDSSLLRAWLKVTDEVANNWITTQCNAHWKNIFDDALVRIEE